jgi:voltage-gated potassium channel
MEKRFQTIIYILAAILIVGTIGYWAIEGWDFLDALYMTLITLTTIGFGEVHQLSVRGKIFTILLVVFGVAGVAYSLRILGQMILEGQLRKYLGRRIMEKQIKKLKGHYIVCGYGRVGETVCQELKRNNVPFVVIERSTEHLEQMESRGIIFISGSCDDDENLKTAGIQRAKGLINTIANEADAVYITLSAKQLNPDLFIMARADSPSVHNKLLKAGATKVISPHIYAGIRMAQTSIRPNVVDFMSLAANGVSNGLKIEEVAIKKGSRLVGTTLKNSGIRSKLGITVIGAKKKGLEMYYNPPPDFLIDEGDTLILIGDSSQLEKIEEFIST